MSKNWSITADWALLEQGSPEERAGFAALGISAYGVCLTAGHDRLLQSIRQAPFLSAYHLAEWLAWNWWRLRWEPRKTGVEWELSHDMASIGNGYIWPNIQIASDGNTIALVAKPTPERENTPYRYINDVTSLISAAEFEGEVDLFIEAVIRRLESLQIVESNLADIWRSVLLERQDPERSRYRKLEALLGEDPDEMDETILRRWLADASLTGQAALEEIAASRVQGQELPNLRHLVEVARSKGAHANPTDRVTFKPDTNLHKGASPAWEAGVTSARLLRTQLGLGAEPLSNQLLAEIYGTGADLLNETKESLGMDLSLALVEASEARVLLRSKWQTGRRFELARLLADALLYPDTDPLSPATRSTTYRQKAQRAFAAELLCPISAVDEVLAGDYSMESQQDAAHHFNVSELTIRTQLANNDRISRSELSDF